MFLVHPTLTVEDMEFTVKSIKSVLQEMELNA